MKRDYIDYTDLIDRNAKRQILINKGVRFIHRHSKKKKILAYILIGFGLLTLPLPTGSIFLIGLGFVMLGLKKDQITKWYKKIIYKYKAKREI